MLMDALLFWVVLSVATVGLVVGCNLWLTARRERERYRNTQITAAKNPRLDPERIRASREYR